MLNRLYTAAIVLAVPFCFLQGMGLFAPLHERPYWMAASVGLIVFRFVVRLPAAHSSGERL